DELQKDLERVDQLWGTGEYLFGRQAPGERSEETVRIFARAERQCASPSAAIAVRRMAAEIDVRHVLPAIGVPTLVMHRVGDIVDSTKCAAELGDRQWRALLDRHDETVRQQLKRFRGSEVKNLGDGFMATFDGPARAVRCAAAISEAVRALGITVRSGLHTGE